MLRKTSLLVAVLFISVLFVSAPVVAQGQGIGDTEFDENESIDTVRTESDKIIIGDIEWSENTLTLDVRNKGGFSTVVISDQASIIGSSQFATIPRQEVTLADDEVVTVEVPIERHDDLGAIVTITDGDQAVTLTDNEDSGGTLGTIGWITWFVAAGIAFSSVMIVYWINEKLVTDNVSRAF